MISAAEALVRLRAGNRRFVADRRGVDVSHGERRRELVAGQNPFAVVLGCSDSRVPAEIVFDQGLGDLFVIRVAGHVVAPSQIGSVEFAVERFGTRLVVVLGHSQCGAVQATLEELDRSADLRSPHLRSIVERITPAVASLGPSGAGMDPAERLRHAVRANIRVAADHLRHGSAILEERIRDDGLVVAEAEYALDTGIVEFF